MPIGIVTDDELNSELERLQPKPTTIERPNVTIVEKDTGGRNEGDLNVPDSLRKMLGEEAVINGRQSALELANVFGISPSSVSSYQKGITGYTPEGVARNKPSIIEHINRSRERAIKKAQKKLSSAIDNITDDKLQEANGRELAGIAKDMSVVIKNLEPDSAREDDGAKAPQFVIFAPQFVKEDKFETIVVSE